jgi:hypothetical protein
VSVPWSSKGEKVNPVDADELLIIDSSDANPATTNKRVQIGNLPFADFVDGPASSVDTAIAKFDGITGKLIAEAGILIDASDNLTGLTSLQFSDANTTIQQATLDMQYDVATGGNHVLRINNIEAFSFNATEADWNDLNILNMGTIVYGDGVRQTFNPDATNSGFNTGTQPNPDPTVGIAGDIYFNSTTNTFRGYNGTIWDDIGVEVTTWTADHDAAGFDLLNVGGITISNPADTFQYIVTPDAILADRILNLPLLTGTDTLVTEAFIQTLTNKTIDASLNTLSEIDETMQTVDTGVSGTVLTSTGVGLAPTYQSSGSQTPWVSDIDADGFDLQDLSNIEFRTTTLAPGATVQAIWADAGGIILNVPTSDTFLLKIQDTAEYSFSATDLDMNQNGLFDVENIVFAETLGAPTGAPAIYVDPGGMVLNTLTGDDFDFQINDSSEYAFSATQVDFNDNNIVDMGDIFFLTNNQLQWENQGQQSIQYVSGTGFIYRALNSHNHEFRVNNVAEYTFDATTADYNSNSIINATMDGDLNTFVDINETQMNVTVGAAATVLTSNGVGSPPTYQALAGTGDVIGPASATDDAIARFDTATGKLIQNGIVTIDDVANVELIRSLQFVSHTASPGPTIEYIAVVNNDFEINVTTGNTFVLEVNETNEYTFDSTAADFNSNNLIMGASYMQLTSIGTPGNSGAATVGRLFLDSGNLNHLTVRRNDGIDVDLEGGSQTPWTSNIDADGFDLQDLSNIEFRNTTGAPAGTIAYINADAGGMNFNIPSADEFTLSVGGSTRITINTNEINMLGRRIVNSDFYQTNAASPSNSGEVRLGNAETVGWRNAGNTDDVLLTVSAADAFSFSTYATLDAGNLSFGSNFTIVGANSDNQITSTNGTGLRFRVDLGDNFDFQINGATQYTFDSTVAAFNGNNLTGVGFLTLTGAINLNSGQQLTWGGSVDRRIFNDGSGFIFEVLTGDTFDFHINSVSELLISPTAINAPNAAYQENAIPISPIGTQTIWANSGAWISTTTNGATFVSRELPTNDVMISSFNFDDTTSQSAQVQWVPPPNWDAGTIRFRLYWTNAAGLTTETIDFDLAGRAYADSDAIDQVTGTAQNVTDTWLAQNDIQITSYSSAITLIGTPTAGDLVILKLSRDVAADDLTGDAEILGIEIEYSLDAATAT